VTDFGLEAQKAAELHLARCNEALWDDPGVLIDSPASAPFCGCDTCVVREVLFAAWPFALREQQAKVERLHREWADALASLNAKLALVLADGVGAEEKDQQ